MKIPVAELKDWFYSDWEEGTYVDWVDDNAYPEFNSFDELLQSLDDAEIIDDLSDIIFLANDEKRINSNPVTHFKKWREANTHKWIKIPKNREDEIIKFINELGD